MLRYSTTSTAIPKVEFARELRRRQTSAEAVLWKKLRNNRFHGFKFRRQVPIGPFIVDFFCLEKRLIIEVDGVTHLVPGAKEKDEKRERYLREQGFSIIRCTNNDVRENLDAVLERIGRVLGCYAD